MHAALLFSRLGPVGWLADDMEDIVPRKQKIAVVIGASSGIGQAAAIRIAEGGARVIVTYNGNADGAAVTVAAIEQAGGEAVALALDVAHSETFGAFGERVGAELEGRWGRPTFDVLVNNAGFGQMAMFEDTTEELLDTFYRVLVKGPFFVTQHLLPRLADGGAIVNTTSTTAIPRTVDVGYSAYGTMKGALATLTEYLAKELGGRGIRVNAVAPGPTRTAMSADAFERFPDLVTPLVERTALGRLGESDDVGRAIAALVADDTAWITGQHIEVSGGYGL